MPAALSPHPSTIHLLRTRSLPRRRLSPLGFANQSRLAMIDRTLCRFASGFFVPGLRCLAEGRRVEDLVVNLSPSFSGSIRQQKHECHRRIPRELKTFFLSFSSFSSPPRRATGHRVETWSLKVKQQTVRRRTRSPPRTHGRDLFRPSCT